VRARLGSNAARPGPIHRGLKPIGMPAPPAEGSPGHPPGMLQATGCRAAVQIAMAPLSSRTSGADGGSTKSMGSHGTLEIAHWHTSATPMCWPWPGPCLRGSDMDRSTICSSPWNHAKRRPRRLGGGCPHATPVSEPRPRSCRGPKGGRNSGHPAPIRLRLSTALPSAVTAPVHTSMRSERFPLSMCWAMGCARRCCTGLPGQARWGRTAEDPGPAAPARYDRTATCSSLSWRSSTGHGASDIRQVARAVLGKAITSRRLSAPVRSISMRSRPSAMPPCGGVP